MNAGTLTCRPRVEADEAFLHRLFASTRLAELAALGGDEKLCSGFLDLQYRSRQFSYRAQHPRSVCRVVELAGECVGQLWVDVGPGEIHLLDISLLPAFRGQGLGARLLRGLQQEAREANSAIGLQVAFDNPARRLYARLGFESVADAGLHLILRWSPNGAGTSDPRPESVHEQT